MKWINERSDKYSNALGVAEWPKNLIQPIQTHFLNILVITVTRDRACLE